MKKQIILISLLCFSLGAHAQQIATGFVYQDLNGNQKKDRSEKGIPMVSVSNGETVVQTDRDGKYSISVGEDQIIFVIKPAAFDLPVNGQNLPQFYYIHKPGGSPELKYPGTKPTGPLPKSVDFGLLASEKEEKFTALVFGDPQPYNLEEIGFFDRGVVKELEGVQGVKFGLSLGDLVGDDLSLFPHYIDAVAKVNLPWYNVMGNHDHNFDVETDALGDETFETYFGPSTYAFNQGNVHFIVLENILYPDPRDGEGYWGGFRPDQMAFIKNDLQFVPKDHLIVLAMHIPLFEEGDSFRDGDILELFEMLAEYPNTLSLSAHTHYQRQVMFGEESGWQQSKPHHHYNVGTTSGDWYKGDLNEQGIPVSTMRDGTPKGYAYFDFDGNQYKIRYQVAGKHPDYQMEIFAPKVLEKDKRTTSGIFVNFFMGVSDDEVNIRIDEGPWKKMGHTISPDPAYLVDMLKWDTTEELLKGKRPSNAQMNHHLWRINAPSNLSAGEHLIEVEATDMYGQKHFGSKTFKILE